MSIIKEQTFEKAAQKNKKQKWMQTFQIMIEMNAYYKDYTSQWIDGSTSMLLSATYLGVSIDHRNFDNGYLRKYTRSMNNWMFEV